MLSELEPHLARITSGYRDAELSVERIAASVTLRNEVAFKQRTLAQISGQLAGVFADTRGPIASFIRLGYVRAARENLPEFKLSEADERRVGALVLQAHRSLAAGLNSTFFDLESVFKRTTVVAVSSRMRKTAATDRLSDSLLSLNATPIVHKRRQAGLEQYARTLLRSIEEQAEQLGRIAAEPSESYGVAHA